MHEFIVELPTYLRIMVEAPDLEAAVAAARAQASELTSQPATLFRLADTKRAAVITGSQLLDAGEDDRLEEVFICRGGKLAVIYNGTPEPTGEDCPLAINQP